MRLNTQNSFAISGFMHLLFTAVIFLIPLKQDYRANQHVDISFLFSKVENEIQNHNTPAAKAAPKQKANKDASPNPALKTMERQNIKSSLDVSPTVETSNVPINEDKADFISKSSGSVISISESSLPVHGTQTGAEASQTRTGSAITGSATFQPVHSAQAGGASKSDFPSVHRGAGIYSSAIIDKFIKKIESIKHYPYIARRKGIEGTVLVAVHLDKTGNLKNIELKASSGHEILDKSAFELIKRVCPFYHGHHSDFKVEIPITYKLIR